MDLSEIIQVLRMKKAYLEEAIQDLEFYVACRPRGPGRPSKLDIQLRQMLDGEERHKPRRGRPRKMPEGYIHQNAVTAHRGRPPGGKNKRDPKEGPPIAGADLLGVTIPEGRQIS